MAPFKKTSINTNKGDSPPPPPSPATATDDFNARRSARVAAGRFSADNDTWVEALAVCEVAGAGSSTTADKSSSSGGGCGNHESSGGGLFRKFKSKSSPTSNNNNDRNENENANNINFNNSSNSTAHADVAAASQRLTLRPYFQSRNTGQRVWDEPPSGASNILYATSEARKMAKAQLEEMKLAYATSAVHRRQEREEQKLIEAAAVEESKKSSVGVGGKLSVIIPKVFKRSFASTPTSLHHGDAAATTTQNNNSATASLLLGDDRTHNRRVKKGSGSVKFYDYNDDDNDNEPRGIPKSILDESRDLAGIGSSNRKSAYEADLQKALVMSMCIGGGSVMGVGDNKHKNSTTHRHQQYHNSTTSSSTSPGLTREEEEQLSMALSISDQEARQVTYVTRRHTPKSSSNLTSNTIYRREMSNESDHSNESKKQQHPRSKKHPDAKQHSSRGGVSITNYHASYIASNAEISPSNPDNDYLDDGGKMKYNEQGHSNSCNTGNDNNRLNSNFGDRGSSWELEWKQSSSP